MCSSRGRSGLSSGRHDKEIQTSLARKGIRFPAQAGVVCRCLETVRFVAPWATLPPYLKERSSHPNRSGIEFWPIGLARSA
jgi:hypothetical protein